MHQRIPISIKDNELIYISKTEIDDYFKATLHSHQNLEILFVIDGEGEIQTTNRSFPLSKGSLVFINPKCKHCEISSSTMTFYAIGLNRMDIFSKEKFTRKIIVSNISNSDYHLIDGSYNTIYYEAFRKLENYEQIIINSLNNLFIYFQREINVIINDSSKTYDSDLISNIKSIIDNNYSNPISLDSLASRFSVSKSSLCHRFKSETNQTIMEYKISRQLEEAYNLLKISDMSISQIAYAVGFNNQSYFNKIFKLKYHKTPKEIISKKSN